MLEWLFGKKKEEKVEKKNKKTQKQEEEEDKWMYDFMLQFMTSPLWRVTLLDFVDNHCLIFDSEDENKFEYTQVHNFKDVICNLFDGMMQQVGLQQSKLLSLLELGLKKDRKIFAQLILCDDFLNFKQIMVKRNKTLEEQAQNALKGILTIQKQSLKQSQKEALLRKQQQEQDEQLQKALTLSLKQAQEREMKQKNQVKETKIQQPKQKEDPEQRKKRLLEQRQKIRKRKQQERKTMLLQSENNEKFNPMNILLQQDGIHESNVGEKGQTKETKISNQQIAKRKQLMKKIRNKIEED